MPTVVQLGNQDQRKKRAWRNPLWVRRLLRKRESEFGFPSTMWRARYGDTRADSCHWEGDKRIPEVCWPSSLVHWLNERLSQKNRVERNWDLGLHMHMQTGVHSCTHRERTWEMSITFEEEGGLFWFMVQSTTVGKTLQWEEPGRVACSQAAKGNECWHALCSFSPGPHPWGWLYSHSGWVLSPKPNLSGNIQRFIFCVNSSQPVRSGHQKTHISHGVRNRNTTW